MLLTPEVSSLFTGSGRERSFLRAEAALILGRYLAGHLLLVGLSHTERQRADLERLDDVDEVWSLSFCRPRPGWRVLGRFAERDAVVGLRAHDRRELGGRRYKAAAEVVIGDWRAMFGAVEPLRGSSIEDYLSGALRDVNEAC